MGWKERRIQSSEKCGVKKLMRKEDNTGGAIADMSIKAEAVEKRRE